MEKIFMIIVLCVYGECQGMWQNTTYSTMDECLAATPAVKEYFMATLPDSSGQIYCMNEENFKDWKKQLEEYNAIVLPDIPTT